MRSSGSYFSSTSLFAVRSFTRLLPSNVYLRVIVQQINEREKVGAVERGRGRGRRGERERERERGGERGRERGQRERGRERGQGEREAGREGRREGGSHPHNPLQVCECEGAST